MMRHVLTSLILFALSLPAVGETSSSVVARCGADLITRDDLRHAARVGLYPYGDPVQAYLSASGPERDDARSYVQKGAEEILWGRHYAELARANGTTIPAEQIARVDEALENCVGETRDAQIREKAAAEGEKNLAVVFAALGDQLATPELREVAYIFREVPTTASADIKAEKLKQLEAVRGDLLSGKLVFADAARRYSEAPSARIGGNLGVISRDIKFNPRFKDFVFSVPAGQVSPVTMLHNGFYIVFVRSARPAFRPTLKDVETSQGLRGTLLSMAAQTSVSAVLEDALRRFPDSKSESQALGRVALQQGLTDAECAAIRDLAMRQLLAMQYFLTRHEAEFKPSEQEIRDYYQNHLPEMFEEGIMRLTGYMIPAGGKRDAILKTADEASSSVESVRQAVLAGETTGVIEKRFGPLGLVVSPVSDWVQGSGDGPTDADLNRLAPGELSKVHITQDGASFYRLEAKRKMPAASLEKKRDVIAALLAREKFEKLYAAERADVMKQLGVEIQWDKLGK